MNQKITVDFDSHHSVQFQAPVPALVTVTNHSLVLVRVLLPYPNPNNLQFRSLTPEFAAAKAVEPEMTERTVPIAIEPGQTYSATYYLNRYLKPLKAMPGEIDYELSIGVTYGAESTSSKIETFSGRFAIQLTSGSDRELQSTLAAYAANLRAPNRRVMMQAAEALAFLDTPLVVPYLLPMLQIDNLEVIGIRALARHPGRESEQAIRSMLTHPDSNVVGVALEEIDRVHISIARNDVQQLLGSANQNTQWLALGWLAAKPSRDDLPLIVPLLDSPNLAVRDRAHAYADRLRQ